MVFLSLASLFHYKENLCCIAARDAASLVLFRGIRYRESEKKSQPLSALGSVEENFHFVHLLLLLALARNMTGAEQACGRGCEAEASKKFTVVTVVKAFFLHNISMYF